MQHVAHLGCAESDEMDLHIWPSKLSRRSQESPGIARTDGQRTFALENVAHDDPRVPPEGSHVIVEGDRLGAAEYSAHLKVILQPFAYTG
jgi:hypothetical protein